MRTGAGRCSARPRRRPRAATATRSPTLARLYADGSLPDEGGDAIKYQVAWIDVAAAGDARLAQPAQRARSLATVDRFGAQLSPAERAAAFAAGHALGASCCGT